MARLTGQYTIPSFDSSNNKIFTPFRHQVVFVFTDGTRKVERSTNANGSYSFDLVNGKYEVSVYLKASKDKERFDLRAGEVFEVTSSTPSNALDKWMQVIGDNGKDELQLYYENLLKQMQALVDSILPALPIDKGGTGATTAAKARENLGALGVGDYGLGDTKIRGGNLFEKTESGFYSDQDRGLYPDPANINAIIVGYNYNRMNGVMMRAAQNRAWFFNTANNAVNEIYSDYNTTVDTNGFIKAASPVLKLFDDRIEHNDQFIGKPRFRKLETGVYEITNTLGLAKEGWTIETPKDRHGRPYFHVIVQESHGRVVLSVHDEYEVRKTETIRDIYGEEQKVEVVEKMLGEARDIKPHERWIDLRFHEEPEEPIDEDEEWMKYLTQEEIEEMNNPSVES